MHENYELDLFEGEFAELLGYEKKILTGENNFVGAMVPNITRSVDWVFLHCDLIKRCSKRCLIQFFNNRASGQLSVSKRTVSA